MSERFSFAVDRHLVPDGSVIWNQEIDVNTTLSDHYVTAIEDTTQYLSVLDSSNEIALDINLTNPKLEVETETFISNEDVVEEDASEDQVVVYTVDGSDDLYGIQVTRDEEGNLQKFQFQFRKNEDGQLEAIPETIQMLPMEDAVVGDDEGVEANGEDEGRMRIFVAEDNSNEHILPDNAFAEPIAEEEEEDIDPENEVFDNVEEQQEEDEEEEEGENIDIKPVLPNVKQELQDSQIEYESHHPAPVSEEEEEETTEEYQHQAIEETTEVEVFQHTLIENEEIPFEENSQSPEEENNFMEEYGDEYQTQLENNTITEDTETIEEATTADIVDEQAIEHVEVNPDMEIIQEEQETSDCDDYQIVEGIHITGDIENSGVEGPDKNSNTNILRHALKTNQPKIKKDNRLFFYVVQQTEKENVDSLALGMSNLCKPKINPRSILKSSHTMFQGVNENESAPNKRFAKCKEAVQARNFYNFINKTTIPQAPIRKDRLPRKQQIKPVERQDEEIVVQEVMVSSNGFVETVNKENLSVTEYVELTDSDDDYDPKKMNKKKKKHKKKRTITISDSEDSGDSIIELDESDDDSSPTTELPPKRRRGRPPKVKSMMDEVAESPSKKAKMAEMSTEPTKKPEIPCSKCEKTFPSQNSLKTHLQHHNLQSSLSKMPVWKYKCEDCGETFKNQILLSRHACSAKFNCSVCLKKFRDVASLNVHKRTHVKEHMVKSTTSVVRVSPRKIKAVGPTSTFKIPKKLSDFKCQNCGKMCSSLQNLNLHLKTHKEYTCTTCSSKFISNLMLEKHLREHCVKSPRRSSRIYKLNETEQKSENKQKVVRDVCEHCGDHFATFKALYQHKVLKHGLETPDKDVLKQGVREMKHTGIPANRNLKKTFAAVRSQINFT